MIPSQNALEEAGMMGSHPWKWSRPMEPGSSGTWDGGGLGGRLGSSLKIFSNLVASLIPWFHHMGHDSLGAEGGKHFNASKCHGEDPHS